MCFHFRALCPDRYKLHRCACRLQAAASGAVASATDSSIQPNGAQISFSVTTATGNQQVRPNVLHFTQNSCCTCLQTIAHHATVLVSKTRSASSACELAICRCGRGCCLQLRCSIHCVIAGFATLRTRVHPVMTAKSGCLCALKLLA